MSHGADVRHAPASPIAAGVPIDRGGGGFALPALPPEEAAEDAVARLAVGEDSARECAGIHPAGTLANGAKANCRACRASMIDGRWP